jgi:hypothetical protein
MSDGCRDWNRSTNRVLEKNCGNCQRSYSNCDAVLSRLGCHAGHVRWFNLPHDGKDCIDFLAKGEPYKEPKPKPECECTRMYAAGASPGWWCPVHKDVTGDPKAVAAILQNHEKFIAVANELHALKQSIAGVVVPDHQTLSQQSPMTAPSAPPPTHLKGEQA